MDVLTLATNLEECGTARAEGRVSHVIGLTVESRGPRISIGDQVWIETETQRRIPAEVVGFKERSVILMPVEHLSGIRPGARVLPGGRLQTRAGYGLLGRVLDGLGRPLDGGPTPDGLTPVAIDRASPLPMERTRLSDVFATGIRSIDGTLTCAKGQRMGIFAGSGVGKSTLLGSLARNACATVNVIALIGERGREVRDFIETALGDGLRKSVVVVATADQSPLMRIKGAGTAVAIAEYFRDRGEHVLLQMDSVTRYAMAQREVGLAIGEPPTTKGYPPSVFGLLARLLERSGAMGKGSITGFFSVLVEGDDMNDPIADAARSILDGHIVLGRHLAEANHYPAVDVLASVSRCMSDVTPPRHRELAGHLRSLLSTYRKAEDLINVGAYVRGSNKRIDESIGKIDAINAFLRQPPDESVALSETLARMERALS
jgi:FliI/YscN family ATPase